MLCPVCGESMQEFDRDAYDKEKGFYWKCVNCGLTLELTLERKDYEY